MSPEEVYDGRGNLLAFLKGAGGGPTLALNGHIDTVAPDLPFRKDGDTFYGRGTSDDMGNVLAMLVSMKALGELCGTRWTSSGMESPG
ncbi:MAG TPA: M20/M25/M40 family metallo-hydrolase [Candidatus Latescibacteria bacterium]|nr:M20/M25/M40 family metallo-hydrolase [Candidatus Latescibacterota bacterium]